jgi:endonuclease/exonuclease/phosphatase family metal-dependent hydrolase
VASIKLLSFNFQAAAETNSVHDYWRKAWHQVLPHPNKQRALMAFAHVSQGFDIVGLQESDRGSLRAGFRNQAEAIAALAGFAHVYGQANRELGWLFSSGNAILSKAAGHARNVALPGLFNQSKAHADARSMRSGRGALVLESAGVRYVNVHLALVPAARARQLMFLAELLSGQMPTIVFGDFNCTANSPAVTAFCQQLGLEPVDLGPSFPSWSPVQAIDLILYSQHFQLQTAYVLPELASDHLAVAAEFSRR